MILLKQIARRARWETRMVVDRIGDRFYSIDTVPVGPMPMPAETAKFGDAYVNGPVSYWLLRYYIDWKKLGPTDVFYDIGCGHGRVLCMVARRRVRMCIGIELSGEFAKKARENVAKLRGRLSPVEVRVGDAAETDYPEGTMFYFGNPFGPATMREVLKRIGDSVATKPRSITCVFVLPQQESRSDSLREVIENSQFLHLRGRRFLPGSPMGAEYWAWEPKQPRSIAF